MALIKTKLFALTAMTFWNCSQSAFGLVRILTLAVMASLAWLGSQSFVVYAAVNVSVNGTNLNIPEWTKGYNGGGSLSGPLVLSATAGASAEATLPCCLPSPYRPQVSFDRDYGWISLNYRTQQPLNFAQGGRIWVSLRDYSRVDHSWNGLSTHGGLVPIIYDGLTIPPLDITWTNNTVHTESHGLVFARLNWVRADPWYGITYQTAAVWLGNGGFSILLAVDATALMSFTTPIHHHTRTDGSVIFHWDDHAGVTAWPQLLATVEFQPNDAGESGWWMATAGPIVRGSAGDGAVAVGQPQFDNQRLSGLSFQDVASGAHAEMGLALPDVRGYRFAAAKTNLFTAVTNFPNYITNHFEVWLSGTNFGKFGGGASCSFTNLPGGGVSEFELRWQGAITATNGSMANPAFPVTFESEVASFDVTLLRSSGPSLALPATSLTLFKGTNATLLASVLTSSGEATIQWLLNGDSLPGATNAVLELTNVQSTAAGHYAVLMTDNTGSAIGSVAQVTILDPWIIDQPTDVVANAGQAAVFSVIAGGTAPVGYQWWFEGEKLTNGVFVSGATSSALTISNTQSTNAGRYQVVVSNSFGAVTSVVAKLRLKGVCNPIGGLVASWRGEGDAQDEVGSNHGTPSAGVSFSPGKVGGAFMLDGSTGSILVPDAPDLNPANQITVEAWVKPADFVGNGGNAIVDKGYTSHSGPYYQYHLGAQGKYADGYHFSFSVAAGDGPAGVGTGPGAWTPDNWYHVVGTYDGSAVKLYTNGVLVGSTPASGAIPNYGRPLVIGGFSNLSGPESLLPGAVDEVSIYDRAITAEEVAQLFAAGIAGEFPGASLPVVPQFNRLGVVGNSLVVSGSSGWTNGDYYVLMSSNLALPLADWTRVATNRFNADGSFSLTNPIDPATPQQFIRLLLP